MPASREPRDRRPLAERLRPETIEGVAGDPRAIRQFAEWGLAWASSRGPPRWRAAILSGPPGVGKTTIAWALARSHGWTVVEMNASDARNQTAVEQTAGRASLSHTLGDSGTYRSPAEGGRTLILLDEADCLTGRSAAATTSRSAGPSLRDFLVGRYGDVASLAEAWGLAAGGRTPPFASWSEVPLTAGRGAWTRLPEAQRDLADWKSETRPRDTSDRGGYGAITKLVRDTRQPVVLTVNDEWELLSHAAGLRALALRIRFRPLSPTEMIGFLSKVVRKERIAVEAGALEAIVRRSRGDLRAAVNDLEAIAPLPPGPLQSSVLATRDTTSDLFDLTREVLTEPRYYRAGEIRDRADASPEDLWPWMEENVPRFASDARGLDRGLARVARGEHFVARARRQRVWSLWSYASEILTGGSGLAISAEGSPPSGTVAFPAFLSGMGRSRIARATRDSILAKAGSALHLSKRKGVEATLPFLEAMLAPGPKIGGGRRRETGRGLTDSLGLSEEEIIYLGGRIDLARGTEGGEPTEDEPADSGGAVPRSGPPNPDQPERSDETPTRAKLQKRLVEF